MTHTAATHIPHPTPPPLVLPPSSPKRNYRTEIKRRIRRPRILQSRLLLSCSTLKKKTEIADQLALDRAEFEGIVDTDRDSRNLIEGYKPGQLHCEMIEDFDPIYILLL